MVNSISSARFDSFRNSIRTRIIEQEVGITLSSEYNDPLDILLPYEQPLLANLVQLVFHDCIGINDKGIPICNGCLNLDQVDNSAFEVGSIGPIEDICDEYSSDGISFADCWSLAGTFALELAAENSYNKYGLDLVLKPGDIPYYYGRTDCKTSPQNEVTFPEETFPNPFFYWDEIETFFKNLFPTWTNKDIIALISGGHTLGRAHAKFSKFAGPWDLSPQGLDNFFLKSLLNNDPITPFDVTWFQGKIRSDLNTQFSAIVDEQNVQLFNLPQSKIGLMFNSDISLAFDLSKYAKKNNRENIDCITDAYARCPNNSIVLIATNGINLPHSNDHHNSNICQYRQCPIQCPSKEIELKDILRKATDNNLSDKLVKILNNISPNSKCTAAFVLQYSVNNTLLVRDFVKIWSKLIVTGYVTKTGTINLKKI